MYKILSVKKGERVVIIIPDSTYSKDIIVISSQLAKDYGSIFYLSLNKSYDALIKNLENNKIDTSKFFFVDAVKKPMNSIKEPDNCIFISSISAIGELSIAINKVLEKGKFECFIFDSLSTMLIYHDTTTITKFIHNLITKLNELNCTAVFTCLEGDSNSPLIKDLGMLVDEVKRLEK